jgi:RNA polymerase sigma-70 factor, ECF subfamily
VSETESNVDRLLRLWVQYQADVYRYVFALVPNPHDTQEVLQSTCVALWKKADEFDFTRPFLPLAFRFALLETKKFREKNRRWIGLLGDEVLEQLAEEREQLHDELELRRQALQSCLGKLPPIDRDLIERHYHKQQTIPEVSEQTGRNIHTLYKAIQRIRRQLLHCVEAATA